MDLRVDDDFVTMDWIFNNNKKKKLIKWTKKAYGL